jgi:phosphoglycerate dehydrogenase-like enzyme
LSTWRFTDSQLATIAAAAPGYTVRQVTAGDGAAVDAALAAHPDTEILYTGTPPTTTDAPAALRWIQLHSAGTDAAQARPVWRWPVALTSGSGITSIAVAELTLAGILTLRRRLPELIALQQRRHWPADRLGLAGEELYGSTALLVGYGSVGRAIGRLLHAAGVEVTVAVADPGRRTYSGYTAPRSGDPDGRLPAAWHRDDELPDLLPLADTVVLCRSASYRPVIGAPELSRLRRDALLVNVGRGGLVDGAALAAGLHAGQLGGAYLDVTDPEPLPTSSPLWTSPRCLVTPHLAGTTRHAGRHAAHLLASNLSRWRAGQPLLNLVHGRDTEPPHDRAAGPANHRELA